MKKLKVACLPVAGDDNPFQKLMMQGLRDGGNIHAFNGIHNKFFGIILTAYKYKPDYIHFDWIESYYYRKYFLLTCLSIPIFLMQLWMCKYIFRIKLACTLHNIFPHDRTYTGLKRFTQKQFARYTEFIRVFSALSIERAKKELHVNESKFRVVQQGAYTSYYPNTISPAEAQKYLNIPAAKKIFLFLGLIKPYKNVLYLIEIFKKMHLENSVLLIAGKCYDKKYLEKIKYSVNENIRVFDSFIPENELQYFYNASHCVILPFEEIENSGSVILAMGFKKLIIAPCKGVLPDILSGQKKFLYSDEDQFFHCVQTARALKDSELADAGEKNFNRLLQFKWELFASCFT